MKHTFIALIMLVSVTTQAQYAMNDSVTSARLYNAGIHLEKFGNKKSLGSAMQIGVVAKTVYAED